MATWESPVRVPKDHRRDGAPTHAPCRPHRGCGCCGAGCPHAAPGTAASAYSAGASRAPPGPWQKSPGIRERTTPLVGRRASWGDSGRTKRHRAVPQHPQAPAGAVVTPAPHGYLAGHGDATQKDNKVVGGIFNLEQQILVPQHLGSHLLPPSLLLLQLPPQLLLQLPAAKHIHIHTTA